MKEELTGRHIDSDDDLITAVNYFLEVQDDDLYKGGIHMLHDHESV